MTHERVLYFIYFIYLSDKDFTTYLLHSYQWIIAQLKYFDILYNMIELNWDDRGHKGKSVWMRCMWRIWW